MFEPNPSAFPGNVVTVLKNALVTLDSDVPVFMRPINPGDPVQSFAISAGMWQPDDDSEEFLGRHSGLTGPTIGRYIIGIQTFTQDMDEERGLATMSTMATAVRVKLSQDRDVRLALAALTSTSFGYVERFTRHKFQTQRYLSNEIDGQFMFLSNCELLIETEVS